MEKVQWGKLLKATVRLNTAKQVVALITSIIALVIGAGFGVPMIWLVWKYIQMFSW